MASDWNNYDTCSLLISGTIATVGVILAMMQHRMVGVGLIVLGSVIAVVMATFHNMYISTGEFDVDAFWKTMIHGMYKVLGIKA